MKRLFFLIRVNWLSKGSILFLGFWAFFVKGASPQQQARVAKVAINPVMRPISIYPSVPLLVRIEATTRPLKLAIIDPNLSLSMPENLALETGFDAFTHLLESYLARKSTRLSQIYSEFGLELIFKNLPKIIDKPNDIKIRANISLGALIGGINVANASTCLPHRLQQAMGSVPEIHHPHARGLACLYPSWLKEVFPETKKKFEKLREVLKVSDDGYDFIIKFMEKIKVNNRLKDYGVKESYINIFVKNISGNVENDPIKEINETLIKRIYTNSI